MHGRLKFLSLFNFQNFYLFIFFFYDISDNSNLQFESWNENGNQN